jgi:hypothetical protein
MPRHGRIRTPKRRAYGVQRIVPCSMLSPRTTSLISRAIAYRFALADLRIRSVAKLCRRILAMVYRLGCRIWGCRQRAELTGPCLSLPVILRIGHPGSEAAVCRACVTSSACTIAHIDDRVPRHDRGSFLNPVLQRDRSAPLHHHLSCRTDAPRPRGNCNCRRPQALLPRPRLRP